MTEPQPVDVGVDVGVDADAERDDVSEDVTTEEYEESSERHPVLKFDFLGVEVCLQVSA